MALGKHSGLATAMLAGLLVGGCAMGDVELNGKIFDWMGVSSSSLQASKREPQLASRQGLIVPPSTDRLPVPGTGEEAAPVADASWPQDADNLKAQRAVAQAQTAAAYCKDRDWFEKAKPAEFARITQNGTLCSGVAAAINAPIEKPKAQ